MEEQGHTKQTIDGCSPRIIKKILLQTLKPIMQYAYDNKVIDSIPKIELSKHHSNLNKAKKKKVHDAGIKLATLYKAIMHLYYDNPLYRALFLSASLGHTNLNTVHQFYLSANHEKASQITNQTIQEITHSNI